MKRTTFAFFLSALLSTPLYAETLCQEEAQAVGYNAPVDTLKPCTPQKNPASQAHSDQAAKARQQQDMPQLLDPRPMEQYGQIQIQE